MKRLFKILIIGCASILSLGLTIYFFFPHVPVVIVTRYWKYSPNKTPYAYLTPTSQVNIERLATDLPTLTKILCGKMELFLTESKNADIRDMKNGGKLIIFSSNRALMINKETDLYETLMEDPDMTKKHYSTFFGKNAFESPFDLCLKALKTTPDSISVVSPSNEVFKVFSLLLYKSLLIPNGVQEINLFRIKGLDGFIFFRGKRSVLLRVFDGASGHYSILVKGFEQTEINAILGRIRFVSA